MSAMNYCAMIKALCATYYGVAYDDVTNYHNGSEQTTARHVAMLLIKRTSTHIPARVIGEAFGGRADGTVRGSIAHIDKRASVCSWLRKDIAELRQRIERSLQVPRLSETESTETLCRV